MTGAPPSAGEDIWRRRGGGSATVRAHNGHGRHVPWDNAQGGCKWDTGSNAGGWHGSAYASRADGGLSGLESDKRGTSARRQAPRTGALGRGQLRREHGRHPGWMSNKYASNEAYSQRQPLTPRWSGWVSDGHRPRRRDRSVEGTQDRDVKPASVGRGSHGATTADSEDEVSWPQGSLGGRAPSPRRAATAEYRRPRSEDRWDEPGWSGRPGKHRGPTNNPGKDIERAVRRTGAWVVPAGTKVRRGNVGLGDLR